MPLPDLGEEAVPGLTDEDVELSMGLDGAALFCLTVAGLSGRLTGWVCSVFFGELVSELQRDSAPPQVEVKLSSREGEETEGVLVVTDPALVVADVDLELPSLGVEVEKAGECSG